jgi:hypothetical protein
LFRQLSNCRQIANEASIKPANWQLSAGKIGACTHLLSVTTLAARSRRFGSATRIALSRGALFTKCPLPYTHIYPDKLAGMILGLAVGALHGRAALPQSGEIA